MFQGEVQGPFSATEMAEWFRAGYFTVSLLVRRQCDERYFTLGDLVKQCPGGVPFLNCRIPPLKVILNIYFLFRIIKNHILNSTDCYFQKIIH